MKPEVKFGLSGTLFCVVGIIIMIWGLSDLVSLFNAPDILIFIIPTITVVIFIITMVILVIRNKKKNYFFNEKAIYYCEECGSVIKLEEKLCSNCGTENIKRKEALERLEELERSNRVERAKILEMSQSKKLKTQFDRKLEKRSLELLDNRVRKIKLRKMKLKIGSTLEDKIKWVKTQFHDMNKSIQDIAEDLGENMDAVRHYIDSD